MCTTVRHNTWTDSNSSVDNHRKRQHRRDRNLPVVWPVLDRFQKALSYRTCPLLKSRFNVMTTWFEAWINIQALVRPVEVVGIQFGRSYFYSQISTILQMGLWHEWCTGRGCHLVVTFVTKHSATAALIALIAIKSSKSPKPQKKVTITS